MQVIVCFGPDTDNPGGMRFNCLSLEGDKISRIHTTDTEATFLKMLAYVGAQPEEIAEYKQQRQQWGQGSVDITVLPGRKNLLGLIVQWSKPKS